MGPWPGWTSAGGACEVWARANVVVVARQIAVKPVIELWRVFGFIRLLAFRGKGKKARWKTNGRKWEFLPVSSLSPCLLVSSRHQRRHLPKPALQIPIQLRIRRIKPRIRSRLLPLRIHLRRRLDRRFARLL